MEKMTGGGGELDDQIVYCNAQWTNDIREQLIGMAI